MCMVCLRTWFIEIRKCDHGPAMRKMFIVWVYMFAASNESAVYTKFTFDFRFNMLLPCYVSVTVVVPHNTQTHGPKLFIFKKRTAGLQSDICRSLLVLSKINRMFSSSENCLFLWCFGRIHLLKNPPEKAVKSKGLHSTLYQTDWLIDLIE